jgi:excisionase family DNA binding protein
MVSANSIVNHKSQPKTSKTLVPVPDDSPPMLRPHCGIWADPSGRVEIMFRLDGEGGNFTHIVVEPSRDGLPPKIRGKNTESIQVFVSVEQAAKLCGFARKTLYVWIETGKLRSGHGLRKFGGQYRIEWKTFEAAVARGEVGSCS